MDSNFTTMEMASFPQKIVLKSTTKISLNDRFTNIQKVTTQRQQQQQQQFRATLAAQQQASSRNRRLTLQMANRPAVQAALKLKARSLKQRLGSNVRSRLNLRGARGGLRGILRGGPRGGRGLGRGRGQSFRGQLKRSQSGGSQLSVTSTTPSFGSAVRGRGGRGARGFRGAGRGAFRGRGGGRGFFRGAGQSSRMPTRGARGGIRGSNQMRIQRGRGRGRRRGGRGMRGEGRGGRGRGGGGGGDVSKEALDAQLDEYMANSQSGGDTGLDAFMTD